MCLEIRPSVTAVVVKNLERSVWSVLCFCLFLSGVSPVLAVSSAETLDAPMTLEYCVATALQLNPSLKRNEEAVKEAEANYSMARAAIFPKFSLSAYQNHLNGDRLGMTSGMPGSLYEREDYAGLSARQLLFDGGKTLAEQRAARYSADAERINLQITEAEVVMRVKQAFYRVLEAQALVKVAEEAVSRQKAFEGLTKAFFEAGKATRLDLLKAESQTMDARKTLASIQETARLSLVYLQAIMGLDMNQEINVSGVLPLFDQNTSPGFLEKFWTMDVLDANLDIKHLDVSLKAAGEDVTAKQKAWFPELSLQGVYGYRDRDIGGGADEWQLGAFLNWSVFDGGIRAGDLTRSKAKYNNIRYAQKELKLNVAAQVKEAISAMKTAASNAEAASKLVEKEKEACSAADALYRAGKATSLDVLTANADLTKARGDYVQALAAYAVSKARLERLTAKELEK
ncbi:MAG: TolC family protein [Dissulfuribacterales bacterium]